MIRRCLVLAALLAPLACGGRYSQVGVFTDPDGRLPSVLALKSAALGLEEFRVGEEIEAFCIGLVSRIPIGEDEERRRTRLAFERAMAERVKGVAPVVVPAEACFVDANEVIRLRSDSAVAIALRVRPDRVMNERTRPAVVVRRPGRGLDRVGTLYFPLTRDDDGWWLEHTECGSGFMCANLRPQQSDLGPRVRRQGALGRDRPLLLRGASAKPGRRRRVPRRPLRISRAGAEAPRTVLRARRSRRTPRSASRHPRRERLRRSLRPCSR